MGLGHCNAGLISDMICCPGGDYCSLANAKSLPVAEAIQRRFADYDFQHDLGELDLNISGCMNACGHHHVGHIGILGLDRAGVENYQITLGGDHTEKTSLGERTGPGFGAEEIVPAIETVVQAYLDNRESADEAFIDTYRRVGMAPFKEALYGEQTSKRSRAA